MRINKEIKLTHPKLCVGCLCLIEPEGDYGYCCLGYDVPELVPNTFQVDDLVRADYVYPRPQKCIEENGE